jgi:hypothetical protein
MRRLSVLAVLALLLSLSGATAVRADSGHRDYQYVAGAQPLCDIEPSACPDVARASNGDTIELTGSGTFSIHPASVTGGGDFTHKNASGDVVATGTWSALKLEAFVSYGNEPDLPSNLEGGNALILVQLFVNGAPVHTATLQVDCEIGKPPPGHGEGIKLAVQGG